MTFTSFSPPPVGVAGFTVVAGREQGLRHLMVVSGRLPEDDLGPVHIHDGDEVLRVVSGEILIRCGDDRRVCRSGDLVVVKPSMPHGFRALTETVLEVVAEYDIGTVYPVSGTGAEVELVEVYRRDLPWCRPPPAGSSWTSDEELEAIYSRLAYDV